MQKKHCRTDYYYYYYYYRRGRLNIQGGSNMTGTDFF